MLRLYGCRFKEPNAKAERAGNLAALLRVSVTAHHLRQPRP
jgi:hypothetical protein